MLIEDSDDRFPKEWVQVEYHHSLATQTAATTIILELGVLEQMVEEEDWAEGEVVDEAELEVEEKEEVGGDGEDAVDALGYGINRVIDPSLDCWIKEDLALHREAYPKVAHHFIETLQGHPDQIRLPGHNSLVLSTLATLPTPTLITSTTMPLQSCRRQSQDS